MISECTSEDFTPLPSFTIEEEEFPDLNLFIADYKEVSQTFTISSHQKIEWIGLTLFSDHTYASDIEIDLVSPQGTKTKLIQGNNSGGSYNMKAGHRYGSLAFMGEKAEGSWTVIIKDKVSRDEGYLKKIQMKIFGH